MAEVRPLRGIRYAQEYVSDIAQVVTPPYDVINKQQQASYYARNPYNVIRLELGQEQAGDNALNNVYTRAATTYSEWRAQGILRQELAPSYYLYQQSFTHLGATYTRTSLLARVRLQPWDAHVILRHEHTLAKAKSDRLNLLRACASNFSPIMCLYDDPQGRMRRLLGAYAAQAEVQFTDEVGEEHRLHPITDVQQIALIQDFFAQRQLYIADGHHRYETALAYRDEIREQRKELYPEDAANFVLMSLIDLDDPGMLVLPTHRMFTGLSQEQLARLFAPELARYFTVQPITMTASSEALIQQLTQAGQEQPAFLISTSDQAHLLHLNAQGEERMQANSHSAAWKTLDVAIAQQLILEEILGLNAADMTAGTYVRYSHNADEIFEAVRSGTAQAALLLNATRVRQICEVAQADDQMPQKSTYFYPKLITGLVMNPLW